MESLSDHFESSEQTFSGSNEHVQKTVDARSVAKHIKKDPLAFDFLLCLVSSAAKTYRRETTLKPVPKLNQEPMDVAKAFQLVDGLPSLTTIMLDPDCLNQVQVSLLEWLHSLRNSFSSCKLTDVPPSVGLAEPIPDFIFKLNHSKEIEDRFAAQSKETSTFFALHGSRLENFHSISQCGLLSNLSKEGLFGEGVYLSNEQSVSLNHSFSSHGWSRSKIGSSLSCVAVCQVIDDPESVKRGSSVGSPVNGNSSTSTSQNRSGMPESYVLVKNGELIMVRYLLVYRTSRSRIQRRLGAIYDEYYSSIMVIMAIVVATVAYMVFKCFYEVDEDSDLQQYLNTEYAHHNIIV